MAPDVRNNLHSLMVATVHDEQVNHHWYYRAVRPCAVPSSWHPGELVVGDCSKGVQFLCKWAGGPDPMGNNFGLYGNSQTLWLRLQHLPVSSDLLIGDIVTFGHDGDEHATMVLERGVDPLLWSFGHQGAPNEYRLSDDGRESQFLRYPAPVYVPTAQDKLRARTDWFAWVAWKLGEGDWKPYGKESPKVRPNVPARIPVGWWKRYAQFLLARKKGNEATT